MSVQQQYNDPSKTVYKKLKKKKKDANYKRNAY